MAEPAGHPGASHTPRNVRKHQSSVPNCIVCFLFYFNIAPIKNKITAKFNFASDDEKRAEIKRPDRIKSMFRKDHKMPFITAPAKIE